MKITRHLILYLLFSIAGMASATAGNITIAAKLDSAHVMMGRTTTLHVNIIQDRSDNGTMLNLLADTLVTGVEIAQKAKPDTALLDNNRMEIKQDVTLQAFEPGVYQLPRLCYLAGRDTVKTLSPIALRVDSVMVDENGDIKPMKDIMEPPFKITDWIPAFVSDYWWLWLLVLAIIGAALYSYFKWFKKGINPLKPVKKRLPPYEEAIAALASLKSRQLWQNGQEKEYYTELTDILRVYIDRRFGINAVEMTSRQIMEKIREANDVHLVNDQLNDVLEIADFVKFANMHTIANDNEIAYTRALNFVEQTRPLPEQEDEKNDNRGEAESNV